MVSVVKGYSINYKTIKEVKQIIKKESECRHTQFNNSGEGFVPNKDTLRGKENITTALMIVCKHLSTYLLKLWQLASIKKELDVNANAFCLQILPMSMTQIRASDFSG